jgi:hypothetical protein
MKIWWDVLTDKNLEDVCVSILTIDGVNSNNMP